MLSLPTSTIAGMETGTWGLGPAVVVVKSAGPWVLGALATQIWPMTDAGDEPETDVFTLQPFVNYNFGPGWALSTSPIISANWDATAGNEWTVPLGLGITRTTVFNRRPLTVGAQYYYNVVRPDGGAGQQLKLTLTLLYPK